MDVMVTYNKISIQKNSNFQNESTLFSSFCFDMNIEQNYLGVPEDKKGR